jgi:hypothetical protein
MSNGHENLYPTSLALGGVGALVGVLADLTAKGSVSTVLRVTDAINGFLGLALERIWVVLLFVVLGTVLTFASQVRDPKKALYVGASIITMFMTIIPNELPPSVGSGSLAAAPGMHGLLAPFVGRALAQPAAGERGRGTVRITLTTSDGLKPADVIITVRDTGGRVLGRSSFAAERIVFPHDAGKYLIVIEAPGYVVHSEEVSVPSGGTAQVTAELTATWKPLTLQRIFRSK